MASHTVPIERVAEADAWTDTLAHSIARNFPGSAPDTIPVFTWDEHGTLPVSVEPERDLAHAAQERFPIVAADGALSVVTCSAIGAALQAWERAKRSMSCRLQVGRTGKRCSPHSPWCLWAVFWC